MLQAHNGTPQMHRTVSENCVFLAVASWLRAGSPPPHTHIHTEKFQELRSVSENVVFLAVASWLRARLREAAEAGVGRSAGEAAAGDALALLRLVSAWVACVVCVAVCVGVLGRRGGGRRACAAAAGGVPWACSDRMAGPDCCGCALGPFFSNTRTAPFKINMIGALPPHAPNLSALLFTACYTHTRHTNKRAHILPTGALPPHEFEFLRVCRGARAPAAAPPRLPGMILRLKKIQKYSKRVNNIQKV